MDGLENIGRTSPLSIELGDEAQSFLKESAKWAKILAIFGFIFTGLLIILGIIMMVSIGTLGSLSPEFGALNAYFGFGAGLAYILMSLMYLYPVWKLYEFANFAKQAVESKDAQLLTQAMSAQKSMYKYWGVLASVLIGMYALLFVIGLISLLAMKMF